MGKYVLKFSVYLCTLTAGDKFVFFSIYDTSCISPLFQRSELTP